MKSPDFKTSKQLLLAKWRKEGRTGEPTDDDVIYFAYVEYRKSIGYKEFASERTKSTIQDAISGRTYKNVELWV